MYIYMLLATLNCGNLDELRFGIQFFFNITQLKHHTYFFQTTWMCLSLYIHGLLLFDINFSMTTL